MDFNAYVHTADLLGVAVFAISGALAAAEKRLDVLGFILFGTITGIGGGTARDLLLNTPEVFWLREPLYLWVCIGASTCTWFLARFAHSLHRTLLWADALGLSLFCVLGTSKALSVGASPLVAVVMGMMTATFGSLIRDGLLGQSPVLLEPDVYVSAALLGSLSYTAFYLLGDQSSMALLIAVAAAFALRAAAIVFDLRLPKFGVRS